MFERWYVMKEPGRVLIFFLVVICFSVPGVAESCAGNAAVLLSVTGAGAGERGDAKTDSLLPASGEITGWERDRDMLEYDAGNLWEYINGSAESFLAYDFRMVHVQDYLSRDGEGLKVEIYRHGNPTMAFGIYSQIRSPGLDYYEIGSECFGDGYSIHFLKGPYYVRVGVFEESEALVDAMKAFSRTVASKITRGNELPGELDLFPGEGLVVKSITYVTKGVLGRSKFPPAFTAMYLLGGTEGKLYIIPLPSRDEAAELFTWYSGIVGARAERSGGDRGRFVTAAGKDSYRGEVALFRYERWMGVMSGFGGSLERMIKVAERFVDRAAAASM